MMKDQLLGSLPIYFDKKEKKWYFCQFRTFSGKSKKLNLPGNFGPETFVQFISITK